VEWLEELAMRDRSVFQNKRLVRIWNWLTEPAALIREPDQKRQARLLAILFLMLLPIGIVRAALPALIDPARGTAWQLFEFRVIALVSFFVFFAYALTRTRFYSIAAVGIIVLSSIAIFAAMVPLSSTAKFAGFYYLILPVLFASIFFSARLAFVVALIDLAGITLVPFFSPAVPVDDLYLGPFSFVAIMSLVILLATYYRNRIERDRQAELSASETRYRNLVENAPIAIYTALLSGDQVIIGSLSPGFEKMTGWIAQDWIGKSFADLVYPPDIPIAQDTFQRVLQGEIVPAYELRIRARSGEYLFGEFVSTPFVRDGVVIGELGVARDITQRKRAEEQVRRRTAQLESLRQIGLELTAELRLDALLQSIIQRAMELTEADGGGLYLYDPARDVIVRRVSVGTELMPAGTVRQRGESLSGKIFATGKPLALEDYAQVREPGFVLPVPAPIPVMGVPIYWSSELLGVLTVGRHTPRRFDRADMELLEMIASYAATAIHNARALESETRAHQRATALAHATAMLTHTLEIEPLLENILRAANEAIQHAEKGSVLLVDEATGELCVRAVIGYHDPRIRNLRFAAHEGYTRHAFETGAPVLLPNLQSGEWRLASDIPEAHALQSAVIAPLRYHDKTIGVISIDNATRPAAFDQDDLELLGAFANQAAAAIENARLHRNIASAGAQSAAFASLGHRLNAAINPNQAARIILGVADMLLGWDACYIDLYIAEHDRVEPVLNFDTIDGRRIEYPNSTLVTTPTEAMRRIMREGAQLVLRDNRVVFPDLVPFGDTTRPSESLMFVPIRHGDNVIGILSIQSYTPNAYDPDSLATLQALADHCGSALERIRAEERIHASLHEKEVLLKEIHHRVKNNLQVVSSLLSLQSAHVKDAPTREIFRDSQNRIRSMALVHDRLYRAADLARIDLGEYARGLATHILRSYGVVTERIVLNVDADAVLVGVDRAISCGLILNELISNAIKHAFPDERRGAIQIEVRALSERAHLLRVRDDGVGLPIDLDFRNTTSLGLQLVNALAKQIHGTVELAGQVGTDITIRFTEPA
jgi:PAS domain S-box-containing protein